MPNPNVLVAVVDGLRASALGAYGNTTFPTPALDAFAAKSLLLDWCYAPSADLDGIYRAMWQSMHPARQSATDRNKQVTPSLPTLFADAGYRTTIVTDETQLASLEGADAFHNLMQVGRTASNGASLRRAGDEFETELACVFAAASDEIGSDKTERSQAAQASQPKLVWLHARGMYGAWDAPLDFQELLRDEDDPSPVESVNPPDFVASPANDPDGIFQYACAYAAQIITLDACWQRLMDAIDSSGQECQWLVLLIGARGFPLGEHIRFGGIDPRLYAEQLHVPWLIRFPDGLGQLARDGRLTSHLDVLPTLIDSVATGERLERFNFDGLSVSPRIDTSTPSSRETLLSVSDPNIYAIRSASWCLRESAPPGDALAAEAPTECSELFVRPDDRWEANDVSKLCPSEVETLRTAAIEMRQYYAAEPGDASNGNS